LNALDTGDPVDEQKDRLEDITDGMRANYTVPVLRALLATDGLCQFANPDGSRESSCADFVDALTAVQPALDRGIVELQELHDEMTGGLPAVGPGPLQSLIDLLLETKRADSILIRGWEQGDIDGWRLGWELRSEIENPFASPAVE